MKSIAVLTDDPNVFIKHCITNNVDTIITNPKRQRFFNTRGAEFIHISNQNQEVRGVEFESIVIYPFKSTIEQFRTIQRSLNRLR